MRFLPILVLCCAVMLSASALEQSPSGIIAIPSSEADEIGGTAVVINENGLAITLAEALPEDRAGLLVVLPGGQRRPAEVLQEGSATTAVLIRIEGSLPKSMMPMRLADSRFTPLGATVWSAGNPFNALQVDAAPALSRGTISGRYALPENAPPVRGRGGKVLSTYYGPVFETTAAVNDGNQGGALLDDRGFLLGLVSLGVARERKLGTAIPIHLIVEDLALDLPMKAQPSPVDPVDRQLGDAGHRAAESTVLVYFKRPAGPGNPEGLPRPAPINDKVPPYRRERLQNAWDAYYHQQQVFFTDQAISAVVINAEEGLLLTAASNLHGNAEEGRIIDGPSGDSAGNEALSVEVLAVHRPLDLAVLKAGGPLPFPSLVFEGETGLEVGDPVGVVGRHRDGGPFTLTTGVVSAVRRRFGQTSTFFNQTDALANYGSLGGPVLDIDGRPVGLITRLAPRPDWPWYINSGVALFVDSAVIAQVLPDLIEGKSLQESKTLGLGVVLDGDGLMVKEVKEGSGAEAAGVEADDKLMRLDGTDLRHLGDLRLVLRDRNAGEELPLLVLRYGEEVELTVTLKEF
jgi:S1-C subfamily serine protease